MIQLPDTTTIRLDLQGPVLHLWLNLPDAKNPLTRDMQREIVATMQAIADDRSIRVVVLRGAGGVFSAGGNLKAFHHASLQPPPSDGIDPIREENRYFGMMMKTLDEAPQAVICLVEGYAFGGGFGLACIGDVTIAHEDAQFSLSEVTLGLVPASISPFVVRRIGLTAARRFAVSGARLSGREAVSLGIAHESVASTEALDIAAQKVIAQILRCAPGAVAETKRLMLRAAEALPVDELLDAAADSFCAAVRGQEGREGVAAFLEKRPPAWRQN